MIVKYIWETRKSKGYGRMCVRRWAGYFLFGFIPVYLNNYLTTYNY